MYYLILSVVATRFCWREPDADVVHCLSSDLNRLVMDYLVIEGYKSAAEEFSKEAGLDAPVDFDSIENRMNIREALQRGDVGDAITRVNDLNPDVSVPVRVLDWPPRGGLTGLNLFMHHAETLRVDGETQHQNFSLQYDPPSFASCVSRFIVDNDANRYRVCRYSTRIHRCTSACSSRGSSSSSGKARSRRRCSLRRTNLPPAGKRARSSWPSLSARWRCWRSSLRR